jgi:hypothetical protein
VRYDDAISHVVDVVEGAGAAIMVLDSLRLTAIHPQFEVRNRLYGVPGGAM